MAAWKTGRPRVCMNWSYKTKFEYQDELVAHVDPLSDVFRLTLTARSMA